LAYKPPSEGEIQELQSHFDYEISPVSFIADESEDPNWNDWIDAALAIYWHDSPEVSGLFVKKSDIHQQNGLIVPSEIVSSRSLLAFPSFNSAKEIYRLERGNFHNGNILPLGPQEGRQREDTSQKCGYSYWQPTANQ